MRGPYHVAGDGNHLASARSVGVELSGTLDWPCLPPFPAPIQVLSVVVLSSTVTLVLCRRDQKGIADHLRPSLALLATWVLRAHTSHLALTRGTQHPPDCFIGHAVITRNVTERFPLLNPLEHGSPFRGRDFPARIRCGLRVARQRYQQRIVKGQGVPVFPG